MNKLELIRPEMKLVRELAECIYQTVDAFLDAVDCMEKVNPHSPEVAGYLLVAIEPVRSSMLEIDGSIGRLRGMVREIDEAKAGEKDSLCEKGLGCAASDGA